MDYFSSDAVTFVRDHLRQHGDVQVSDEPQFSISYNVRTGQGAPEMTVFLSFKSQMASEALAQMALVQTNSLNFDFYVQSTIID